MADTWWRFYNTAPDHPKILGLNDMQFRTWATLNSMASKMGGEIPDDMPLIARTLRRPEGKSRELIQVLLSARLLDRTETGYRPHNWNEKQYKSDVSTERVKRFREREKERDGNAPETEAKPETERKKKDARMARFNEFWLVCPKKTGKGAAEKAWPKALDLADADVLIAGMRAYSALCAKLPEKDRHFIKTPGPWLNEKRWLDEGIAPAGPVPTAEQIEAAKDRADKLLKRGKYAETYQ